MNRPWLDPKETAFDIDGVVADIMSTFLWLAAERYQITHLRYEDIRDFDLCRCLRLDEAVVNDLLALLLQQPHLLPVEPLPQAVPVLTALARRQPLLFVTARDKAEPITLWLQQQLPAVAPEAIKVIATGDPDRKVHYLLDHGIRYFVEDRLETCFHLASHGILPVVFAQPWNRRPHPFIEVGSWQELSRLFEAEPLNHDR